jgi:hypothetical protein
MQQESNDEQLGVPPSIMTAEFLTPEGTRYNFEQVTIQIGTVITLTNESGNELVLTFRGSRVSEKEFPMDAEAEQHYVNETLPTIGKRGVRKLMAKYLIRLKSSLVNTYATGKLQTKRQGR